MRRVASSCHGKVRRFVLLVRANVEHDTGLEIDTMRRRVAFPATAVVVLSMAGSFVFGLLHHFLLPGPDNVFAQPPGTWRSAFQVSVALLALL